MPTVDFIHTYFNGEKKESLLFIILGLAGILAAILLIFIGKTNFYKGVAIPFIAIGILHFIVGFSIYTRSNTQRIDMAYQYGIAGNKAPQEEITRMEKVIKNFVIYRYAEIFLILVGLGLIFFYKTNIDKSFWYGLGIALALEAAISLSADFFAEKRGNVYLNTLQEANKSSGTIMNPNINNN
jgi:hypothetical protein